MLAFFIRVLFATSIPLDDSFLCYSPEGLMLYFCIHISVFGGAVTIRLDYDLRPAFVNGPQSHTHFSDQREIFNIVSATSFVYGPENV